MIKKFGAYTVLALAAAAYLGIGILGLVNFAQAPFEWGSFLALCYGLPLVMLGILFILWLLGWAVEEVNK